MAFWGAAPGVQLLFRFLGIKKKERRKRRKIRDGTYLFHTYKQYIETYALKKLTAQLQLTAPQPKSLHMPRSIWSNLYYLLQ